jgi:hypothetical protein
MGNYLKTVVTYSVPAEAEVDRAFLESEGLTVCLLNANTTRNEIGAAFFIQLQVNEDEYQKAVSLLREMNPSRFGSQTIVDEIDRSFRRNVGWFFLGAIPLGILFLCITPSPTHPVNLGINIPAPPDLRLLTATVAAILGGTLAIFIARRTKAAPRISAE